MTSMMEHIKDKKIYYIAGVGIAIGIATLVWLGVRKNAIEVQIDGQPIGIVKTKEEAQALLQGSIQEIEKTLGKDIAIHQEITAIPVHSKKSELVAGDVFKDNFQEKITYDIGAVEILINGEVKAIVESKEVSENIFKHIALMQLPQGSNIQLLEGELPTADTENTEKAIEQEASEGVEGQAHTGEEKQEGDKATVGEEASLQEATTETKEMVAENLPQEETKKEDSLEGKKEVQDVAQEEVPEKAQEVENDKIALETVSEAIEVNENMLTIEEAVAIKSEPIEIHVGEVEKAVVQTRDGKPVDTVQREYKAFDFNKEVKINKTYVEEEKVMTEEEALNILLSNTDEVVKYVMQPGDNVWDVAIAHGTTMDRILEINPQITDVTRMQIGEEIKVEAPDPILSIATTEVAIFNEIIPAEIEYVADKDMYKGDEKVRQEGEDGLKKLTVSVDKVNGKEVSRTHLAEEILKEPTKKIIAYGTKEKPKNSMLTSVTPAKKGTFMHPLNGGGRISSQYGGRGGGYHRGIDIAAPAGTPIYAAASGTVIYSGYNTGGFGKLVMIDHGNGYQTYYAHNSKLNVKVGQKVSKGQNIAAVGSTGDSTGNHVHFEIRKNGKPINPYSYIY